METLPSELLLALCTYACPRDLVALCATNRSLRSLVLDASFLRQRFGAQPMSYGTIAVGKDLLFAPNGAFRPGVTHTEVLRFIVDGERAVELVNRAYKQGGQDGIDYNKAYTIYYFGDAGCWHLLWAICSLDNVYLAQALYHGEALYRSPMAGTYRDIYFDLLFRYGMWKEAKRGMQMPLAGEFWRRKKIPKKYRRDLVTKREKVKGFDVVGFRRVLSSRTDILCPYISANRLAEILRKEQRDPDLACVALRLRGVSLQDIYSRREMSMEDVEFYGKTIVGRNIVPHALECMREGRWRDDLTSLLALANEQR